MELRGEDSRLSRFYAAPAGEYDDPGLLGPED
jgi:hypothetical protein